ncbi:MAG: PAS domain S-box protein [Candidatus Brocadia sp.]|nr:PAS domain S-box protein [Candidatus Brocadia sp.]
MNFFEEHYHSIFKRISSFAYDFRVESNGTLICECVTASFVHITGYTFEETNTCDCWLNLIHPDDISIFAEHLDCLLSGQSDIREFRIITKGGEIRWLRNYAHPSWRKTQGRVIRIYGTAQDITKQMQHEDRIKEPESGYYTLLETANATVEVKI